MKKGDNFIRIYREYKFKLISWPPSSTPLSYPKYYEEWQAIEIIHNDYKSGNFVEKNYTINK